MNIPLTQSKKWQKLQENLGEISHFEETSDYQFLAIEKHTKAGNYLFLPYGPIAEDSKGFKKAISALQAIAQKSNAIFIRVEPMRPDFIEALPKETRKTKDIEPAETWILDLPSQSNKENEQEISPDLKNLIPSRLYRYYKNREKQGIAIETSHNPDDIKHLIRLQKALASKKGISTFTEHYLKTELEQPFATLYLLKKEAEVLAAGLVFDDEDTKTRYNLQGAQSEEGRPLHATGILTIQLIIDAYNKGYKTFDFWGIAPEGADSSHPWYGFTAFKKTFNGREQKYAGTYDVVIKPNKYKIFKTLQKLQKIIK